MIKHIENFWTQFKINKVGKVFFYKKQQRKRKILTIVPNKGCFWKKATLAGETSCGSTIVDMVYY